MRTSRISQDASKFTTSTPSSSQRITRASLSRFVHTEPVRKTEEQSPAPSTDIEDSINPGSRKRRRSVPSKTAPTQRSPRKIIKSELLAAEPLTQIPSPNKAAAPARTRKPARRVKNESSGEVEIHPPNDWAEVYALVKEMRISGTARNAAVDTMGCESLAADNLTPKVRRYQTLTALMLSSQTKDTTNAQAMARLQRELVPYKEGAEPGLTLENILAVEPEKLNEMIWVVGFHNNKTKYIKATAEILRDNYAGDIPDSAEGLMSLPGVGPKMAYLCLSAAWGRDEGIGVDVHVHRITNLWGWNKTKGPEETRIVLQSWLPRDKWHEINWLLVGLGQTVCLPVGRKCGECDLGLKGLCKSADRGKVGVGRKIKEELLVKIEEQREAGASKEEIGIKDEEEKVLMTSVVKVEVLDDLPLPLNNVQEGKPIMAKEEKGLEESSHNIF